MNVIILEDHKGIVDEIKIHFDSEFGVVNYNVFNQNSNFIDFIKNNTAPDVLIFDLRLDNSCQFEALSLAIGLDIACYVYSGYSNRGFIEEVKKMGAKGFVNKSSGIGALIKAIKYAENKEFYMCPAIQYVVESEIFTPKYDMKPILTNREIEVIELLILGYNNEKIADKLNCGFHSVRAFRRNMLLNNKCTMLTLLRNYMIWYK